MSNEFVSVTTLNSLCGRKRNEAIQISVGKLTKGNEFRRSSYRTVSTPSVDGTACTKRHGQVAGKAGDL